MTAVRSMPCRACPYRRDAPSGVWHRDEYDKLRRYDNETWAQPTAGFACHASPDHYCNGWAIVHSGRGHEHDLLALRICWPEGGIPETNIAMFSSGNEAADHGLAEITNPTPRAIEAAMRLVRKHHWIET